MIRNDRWGKPAAAKCSDNLTFATADAGVGGVQISTYKYYFVCLPDNHDIKIAI